MSAASPTPDSGEGDNQREKSQGSESDHSLSPASSRQSLDDQRQGDEAELPALNSPPKESPSPAAEPAEAAKPDRLLPGVGRGRGGGGSAQAADGGATHLRRPGARRSVEGAVAAKADHGAGPRADGEVGALGAIVSGLNGLSLADEEEDALDGAKALAIKVKEMCATAQELTVMLHALHERSLLESSFASKTALLFGCLSQLEVEGVKCRSIFLRKIQEDFNSQAPATDGVRGADRNSRRRNLIVLLCQIFRRVRVADGTTIKALTGPIITGLNEILGRGNCSDEDISVITEQLQVIGPELKLSQADQMSKLSLRVRELIADSARTLEPRTIVRLLLILELTESHGWKLPTTEAEAFYDSRLPVGSRFVPMEVSRQPVLQQQNQQVAQPATSTSSPSSNAAPSRLQGGRGAPRIPLTVDVSRPPPTAMDKSGGRSRVGASFNTPPPQATSQGRHQSSSSSLFQDMPPLSAPVSSESRGGWGQSSGVSGAPGDAGGSGWGQPGVRSAQGWGEQSEADESTRTAAPGAYPGAGASPRSRFAPPPSAQSFNIGTWE